MASVLNKRHQARNEKALQELVKSVPGNDRCADCQARNPGWASWSLGIFLCMRCAALHRKLGTHVTKVKSLSMDSWSTDQVENMTKIGNANANRYWNPQNTKPAVPLDVDEVDSAMERYVRQKYEQKAYTAGGAVPRAQPAPARDLYTGGTGSSDEQPPPPPPPPKSGRKFGLKLRSASALVLSKNDKSPDTPRKSSLGSGKVFGTTIGVTDDGLEWKLVTLREMGFPDEGRNSSILKGLNGDLELAIESLVRLGERSGSIGSRTPSSAAQFRSQTSTPTFTKPQFQQAFAGISVQTRPAAQALSQSQQQSPASATTSYNPFDNISPTNLSTQPQPQQHQQQQPQQQQRQQQQSPVSATNSYNPFNNISPTTTSPKQQQLEQTMQNLQLGQAQQPPSLFPHSTGGYADHSNQFQQNRLQQSMTPPAPQLRQNSVNNPYAQQETHNPFYNPMQQAPLPIQTNPFSYQQQQQPQPQSPQPQSPQPQLQQQTVFAPSNPFLNQTESPMPYQDIANPIYHLPVQNQAQLPQNQPIFQQSQQQQPWVPQQAQQPQTQYHNVQDFSTQGQMPSIGTSATFPGAYQQQQPLQQVQPMSPQQTGRIDKSSILALYNYPQLAPAPAVADPRTQIPSMNDPSSPPPQAAKLPAGVSLGGPQRSVTMPMHSSNKNPFSRPPLQPQQANGGSHGSRESMDNGRHSPDAFASLSARFER